jgi:hypothetical protein
MKLMLISVVALAFVPSPDVRFEAGGVVVGSEMITGSGLTLRESRLVSGSVVENLAVGALTVGLGDRQLLLEAGLRLTRTADGFQLSSHGVPFRVTAGGRTLSADRVAAFKLTDKGFDFGALGALEGLTFAARVTPEASPREKSPIRPRPILVGAGGIFGGFTRADRAVLFKLGQKSTFGL